MLNVKMEETEEDHWQSHHLPRELKRAWQSCVQSDDGWIFIQVMLLQLVEFFAPIPTSHQTFSHT
jgi:hypothetical protein